ncbi:MAG: T9SS type A sorting domain-containing protein [Bacteroidales bacterium]|nr:T9SS type A sorting domain-containing protein [Bacteroidales bacterium]
MKKLFTLTTLILFAAALVIGQTDLTDKGAYQCSHKKAHSKNHLNALKSPNTPRHTFDVLNYSLNFDLYNNFDSPYPQSYDANEVITFRVDTALNMIKLNALNSSMDIISVGMAGTDFLHTQDTLTITLDREYLPGEVVDVSIDYYHKNVEDNGVYANGGFLFTDFEPEGARKCFPCYDRPSDKATTELIAKVPSNVLLGSNGRLADSTTIADTTWFHWISRDPVPTYLVVISAKKNWNLDIVYWDRPSTPGDPMPIRFYYNDGENPSSMEQKVPLMADWYSQHYGEHPFEKDGFAALNNEFSWGGMENQTLTSLCPGCWSESLICHEFAHQWFGDAISPGTWADLWLNEGFATWSESLWWEMDGGYAAYKSDVLNNASYYMSSNPGWPVYNPEWAENTPGNNTLFNYAITYCKSSCMLHLLRYSMGDELFFQAIYDYATDTINFRYKNAVTEDFQAKLEASSGLELGWFFESWVKEPNHPIYANEYSFADLGNGTWNVNFLVNQVQANAPFFPIPIELTIFFMDGSDTVVRTMNNENQEFFWFNFNKQPVSLFFDKNNEIVIKQATLAVGIDEEHIGSQTSRLDQNYPNPADAETTISYALADDGLVSIGLYDISGKKIRDLLQTKKQKGTHALTFDVSGFPAGIYYYSMHIAGFTATKKLIVQ